MPRMSLVRLPLFGSKVDWMIVSSLVLMKYAVPSSSKNIEGSMPGWSYQMGSDQGPAGLLAVT